MQFFEGIYEQRILRTKTMINLNVEPKSPWIFNFKEKITKISRIKAIDIVNSICIYLYREQLSLTLTM